MKLVALCLFAVCCSSLVNTTTTGSDKSNQLRKLGEVLLQLNEARNSLQNTTERLIAPPQDIEDCCCLSALKCFRDKLSVADKSQKKLYRSLGHSLTVNALDFCNSAENSTCQSCDSYPKANSGGFFNRLESLIQRAITKLNMN